VIEWKASCLFLYPVQLFEITLQKKIKRTAVFGIEPKAGLVSSSKPEEIIERLASADDLLRALSDPNSANDVSLPPPYDQLPASLPHLIPHHL